MILMIMLVASLVGAKAQVLYGSLNGAVTDPSGGAIPGATVVVREIGTGSERSGATGEEGLYLFTNLNPGVYRITIQATGFATVNQENVEVSANTANRIDLKMQVGGSTEEITVSSAPPALQTQSAQTGTNISEQQITELPTTSTAGRNVQGLYAFIPGSTPPLETNSLSANPMRALSINVNGGTSAGNSTRIDGAVDAFPGTPNLVAYIPPPDGIEAINVVTGSFNAEQGSAGGAAINMIMKSGTNRLHGSVWEFNSFAQENAQSWQNRSGILQKNIYNETGGSIGGPILRNKLFFFVDYNRVNTIKSVNGTLSVPTLAMRSGDFTGTGANIYDPATGTATGTGKTQFSGNRIPTNRISQAAATLLRNLPAPNFGAAGALLNNYFGSANQVFLRNQYDSKLTYAPTGKTNFFGHYSAAPYSVANPPVFGSNPGGPPFDVAANGQPGHTTGLIQNVGAGFTHIFTDHFVTDWNAGFTRQRFDFRDDDVSLGDYGVSALGIPGTNNNGDSGAAGIPAFFFSTTTGSSYTSLGNATSSSPTSARDNQYTANANATWVKGQHSIRFGGEYIHSALNRYSPGQGQAQNSPRGSFIFTGGATALSGAATGSTNQFADFLLGQADVYQKAVQSSNPYTTRFSTFSFYAQDTWQVSPKLTLNYGVRYEYYPLLTAEKFGTVRYDPSVRSTLTSSTGVAYTVGTTLVGGQNGIDLHAGTKNGMGLLVPRFGISYLANDKTVLRAGFGITVTPEWPKGIDTAYPTIISTIVSGVNGYVPATSLNPGLLSPVTQVGIPALTTPSITPGYLPLPNNVATNTLPQNFRRGYVETYNVAFQRQLPLQFTTTVSYVGSHTVRQLMLLNINPAAPGGGTLGRLLNQTYSPGVTSTALTTSNSDIMSLTPFGTTSYNGLQTNLTRTSAKRGSIGVVYTYSKTLDIADNGTLQGNGPIFAYPTYYRNNWAVAGFDRTHNLQLWTIYDLPFGKGQAFLKQGIAGKILGGWRLSTTLSRSSGLPINVTASTSFLNAPGNTQVADRNFGVPMVLGRNVNGARQYLNPAAFADVTAATATTPRFGTAGRNPVRGPGLFNLNASLKRTFPIYESLNLDLVADAFDVTNTPQFANPAAAISSPSSFGVITTSNVNRTMRLSARVSF